MNRQAHRWSYMAYGSIPSLAAMKSKMKSIIKAIWQFCTYLFVPQMGKQRRKRELLKKDITYLIGKERAEGNISPIPAEYISRVLNVPLEEVEKVLKEMGM